jgi:hypothetical protein
VWRTSNWPVGERGLWSLHRVGANSNTHNVEALNALNADEILAANQSGHEVLDVFPINERLYRMERELAIPLRWDAWHFEPLGYEMLNIEMFRTRAFQMLKH